MHKWGLGDADGKFLVYIDKQPRVDGFVLGDQLRPQVQALNAGDIYAIGQACGNGWRKVFNLYAKLVFALGQQHFGLKPCSETWQRYREQSLLQAGSHCALLFSPPVFKQSSDEGGAELHLVMGRTYAKSLALPTELVWLDDEFAIAPAQRLIVCPYFDYRQLSNIKLLRLVSLIEEIIAVSPIKLA